MAVYPGVALDNVRTAIQQSLSLVSALLKLKDFTNSIK